MEIQKQDINEMFKEMVNEAVAFAIVGKDGQVAYSYAQNIKTNFDPHDASHILKMIAQLSEILEIENEFYPTADQFT